MIAYLFPGQGSQEKGMGANLFAEFSELTDQASNILGYSIKELCLIDSAQQLNQTFYTQPAIFIVNALSYFSHLAKTNIQADFVTGHSLGEYNALLAANVFDFATGLKLVQKRAELMQQATDGGMAAIIGLNSNDIDSLLKQHGLTNIHIANYNTYTQCVISGPTHDINLAKNIFSAQKSVTFHPLKVSGAFHSPFMINAQTQFLNFLEGFNFSTPMIPVLANVDATPYHPIVLKTKLANQIAQPVQWVKIIEYLLNHEKVELITLGYGNILNGLIKKIQSGG